MVSPDKLYQPHRTDHLPIFVREESVWHTKESVSTHSCCYSTVHTGWFNSNCTSCLFFQISQLANTSVFSSEASSTQTGKKQLSCWSQTSHMMNNSLWQVVVDWLSYTWATVSRTNTDGAPRYRGPRAFSGTLPYCILIKPHTDCDLQL